MEIEKNSVIDCLEQINQEAKMKKLKLISSMSGCFLFSKFALNQNSLNKKILNLSFKMLFFLDKNKINDESFDVCNLNLGFMIRLSTGKVEDVEDVELNVIGCNIVSRSYQEIQTEILKSSKIKNGCDSKNFNELMEKLIHEELITEDTDGLYVLRKDFPYPSGNGNAMKENSNQIFLDKNVKNKLLNFDNVFTYDEEKKCINNLNLYISNCYLKENLKNKDIKIKTRKI